jgi:hypothetical protein
VSSGVLSCIEKGSDTDLQFSERQFAERRATTEEQQPIRYIGIRQDGAQTPAEAIAGHGIAQGATDRKRNLRRGDIGVVDERTPHGCTPDADAVAP